MTEPVSADSDHTRSTATNKSARRRWPRRLAMVLAGLAIVLVLSIFVAPRYIARYLLAAQFDALGIAHEGLHTLELELLQGRVAIGPVSLGIGQQAPARLAHFEASVDLAALFESRISIENVTVRGIELQMSRTVDGEVSVNGMRAATLAAIALAPGLLNAEILGLSLGLASVELSDSHLRVQTPWGGHLDIALQRLALSGFRGWQAEQATSFQLEATVNDMPLRLSGDATPLLAEPSLRVETFVDEMTVERIARLTNAAKLDRAKGRYSVHSNHELSMARSGELSGHSRGTLTLTGADYLVPGLIEASANRLQAGFEADYRIPAAGGWQLSGSADLSLDEVRVSGPEQARLEVRALHWQVSDVRSSSDVAGNGHLQLTSELQADDAALRGQLRLSVQMIVYLLRALQFLAAGTDMNTPADGIDSWANREIRLPAIDLAIARLHSKSERLEVTISEQGVRLTLDNIIEVTAIHTQTDSEISDAESLRLAITKLRLTKSPQGASLDAGLSAQASSVKMVRHDGEVAFDTMEAAIESGEIKLAPESLSGRLDGHAGITRVNATLKDKPGLPATKFALAGGLVTVRQASVSATADSVNWKIEGGVQTSEVDFKVGEPNVARGAVGRMVVTGIQIDETSTIVTDSIELQGVDVAILGSHLLRELASHAAVAESAAQAQPDAKPDAKPDAIAKSGGQAPVARTLAGAKSADADVSLQRIQRALLEHGFDPGPLDGIMGRQTVAAIKALQASKNLAADGNVSEPLLRTLGLLRPGAADQAQAPTEPGPPIRFKLNTLQIAKGAKLHFSDDTAEPDVDVTLVFDTLSVRNLDTEDPDQRLQVHASAVVNDLSHAEIRGWLAPLREPLDLDLKIVLQDVELSPFASYTDYYLGLSIDEGQLSTVSTIAIQDGALDAQLELDIWRLQVEPLSEADEQKIADVLGISVVTAVRLVKDAEGGIKLSIPISGTVDDPQVDASDGVNKAIGSVVVSLLPTTWIADLFSSHDDDVDFEPVVFAAGSNELSESGRQNLDRLAGAMQQHPDAVITVCGRATGVDNPVLRSRGAPDDTMALWGNSLAVKRTRSVRRYLVQEKDLPARRVTECRAAYLQSDPKPPRVDISL